MKYNAESSSTTKPQNYQNKDPNDIVLLLLRVQFTDHLAMHLIYWSNTSLAEIKNVTAAKAFWDSTASC